MPHRSPGANESARLPSHFAPAGRSSGLPGAIETAALPVGGARTPGCLTAVRIRTPDPTIGHSGSCRPKIMIAQLFCMY